MDKEQMKQEPQPWEFRSKPAWQRLIVMCGGVIVNFLLAWIIYSTMLVVNGDTYVPADRLKYGVQVDSIGQSFGFKTGDQMLAIDGKKIKKFDDFQIQLLLGDEATVLRDGTEQTVIIDDLGKKAFLQSGGRPFITPRYDPVIGEVRDSTIAKSMGVLEGDKLLSANGKELNYWDEFTRASRASRGDTLTLVIERDGRNIVKSAFIPNDGYFGVLPNDEGLEVTDTYGVLASIPAGFTKTIKVLTDQVRQFKVIFNRKTEAYKQVKGPIGIVEILPPTWDWGFFWSFTAMFSVWLAFVNILPIPALDGGHVMFLLYEMITGKAPSEKTLERGQIVGFVIVMGIMLIVFGNDIWNIVKRFL